VTLCERFAELLKGPQTVTAHKQSGRLFGVSGDDEGMSLRIGEVQQIYPEIWRHLDEARAAFAARGVDVSAYDQIRASEGLAIGAAVDMTRQHVGAGQYSYDQTVKSANFNKEGYARAVKASDALMRATPDIDWAGIAKAEADDPHIKAFTRSTSTKKYVMIGLLVAVIAAPFVYVGNTCRKKQQKIDAQHAEWRMEKEQLSDGDRKALDAAITASLQRYTAAKQAWPAAVAPPALAALKSSASPCEFKFAAPSPQAVQQFVKYGSMDDNFADNPFLSFKAGETPQDLQVDRPLRQIEGIAKRAAQGDGMRGDIDNLRQLPTHVVFVMIDKETEPVPEAGTAYKPGEVLGRGYVFSVAQRRIVCAGVIQARNAAGIETSPRDEEARETLFRDLEMQVRQALATGLRAI
jgi:hypothetical protein